MSRYNDFYWPNPGFDSFLFALAREDRIELQIRPRPKDLTLDVQSPLRPLLQLRNSAGVLTAAECEQVLPRLLEILDQWTNVSPPPFYAGIPGSYDRRQGWKLAAAMQACVEDGVDLNTKDPDEHDH